jgi:putative ABC transport system permease protein
VTDQINKLGSNLLIVTPGSTTSSSGVRGGRGSATTLTMDDAAVLADPAWRRTSPGSRRPAAARRAWWPAPRRGRAMSLHDRRVARRAGSLGDQGRFFTAAEVASESSVAVLGATTAAQLLGSTNAVGQTITLNGQNVTVIGVLNTEGSTTGGDQDDLVLMPHDTYAGRLSTSANPRSVSTIYIEAKDRRVSPRHTRRRPTRCFGARAHACAARLHREQSAGARRHGDLDDADPHRAPREHRGDLAARRRHRRHEHHARVGDRADPRDRAAQGARCPPRIILRQFLVEASLLGLVGGLAGLALGMLGAAILPGLLGQPVTISPVAAAAALVVSLGIGIGAGVYPASRAAKLPPIEALRSE